MYTFDIDKQEQRWLVRFFRDGQIFQHWTVSPDETDIEEQAQQACDLYARYDREKRTRA